MKPDSDSIELLRLHRGAFSALWSFPLVGGSPFAPQFMLLILPWPFLAWNPIAGAVVGGVLGAMVVGALSWRASISGDVLTCSVLGLRTLSVDLRQSGAVFRQVAGGGHTLSRVIFLRDPAVVYRRFGDPNAVQVGLYMANCLGKRREKTWLTELGKRTKRGYLGTLGSDGAIRRDELH